MKIFLMFVFIISVNPIIRAQSVPMLFNYQVALRDLSTGQALPNQYINLRITILNGSFNGPEIYKELQYQKTNPYGVASLLIGSGTNKIGLLESINFLSTIYYIKVEAKDKNGIYNEISNTQLVSVPYAIASKTAFQLDGNGAASGQVLKWNGNKWNPEYEKSGGSVTSITAGPGLSGGTITTTGTISLPQTGVAVGSYGSTTEIPVLSINSFGQITSASKAAISNSSGGTVTKIIAGTGLTGGTITNVGTISITNTTVIPGTYGSSTLIPQIQVNPQGQITNITNKILDPGSNTSRWLNDGINNIKYGAVGIATFSNSSNNLNLSMGTDINQNGELIIRRDKVDDRDKYIFLGFEKSATPGVGYFPIMGIKDGATNTIKAGFRYTGSGYEMFATIKNFIVDHPFHEDEIISYACIEGPEAAAYERGTAKLVNGRSEVLFSEHFSIIVNPLTMTINLTPISLESKGLAIIEKKADGFTIGELNGGKGNYSFDWEVKGVRKGFEDYRIIRNKSEYQTKVDNETDIKPTLDR